MKGFKAKKKKTQKCGNNTDNWNGWWKIGVRKPHVLFASCEKWFGKNSKELTPRQLKSDRWWTLSSFLLLFIMFCSRTVVVTQFLTTNVLSALHVHYILASIKNKETYRDFLWAKLLQRSIRHSKILNLDYSPQKRIGLYIASTIASIDESATQNGHYCHNKWARNVSFSTQEKQNTVKVFFWFKIISND